MEEEIVDKTGNLTHYLANTHSLQGTMFIPNHSASAIYQKKTIDALFDPDATGKSFYRSKIEEMY